MATKEKLLLQFAKNLQALRKKKGMSIRELAAASDLEYSQVQRIENGKVNFAYVTLVSLANGLEIHPRQLLDF